MAKEDLEERTVFAEPEEGGTIAISRPPPAVEARTDPEDTQPVLRERAAERNTVPETEQLISRTGYAAEGVRVAVLFAHRFGRRLLGNRAHLQVKLNEPGVSTEAGTRARQAIVLVATKTKRGTTTIGWLDIPRSIAELKSYPMLAEQHRSRRGQEEFDVGREEYEALLGDLDGFLRGTGITPSIAELPSIFPKSGQAVPVKRSEVQLNPRTITAIIVLILMIGIGIGFAARGCGEADPDHPHDQPRKSRVWPRPR